MSTYGDFIGTVNNLLNEAKNNEIIHLETKNGIINSNILDLGQGDVVHFGSCSYLGLEFDERMKQGSIDAINKYGTQFSSSRAYLSISLYSEYEKLLSKIFDAHTVVTPTTTLGHIAAIPTLVDDKDAVILDHQVHSSVQNAVNLLKFRNIHIETLKHNDMSMLEERIITLLSKNKQVWYMADGIYSMYGDGLPAKELTILLNKYKNFRLYVDDAHGMSWAGKNGRGYTLSKMDLHPQMILAISLAKGFGSGGGILVFPTKEQAQLIRTCGGPMVTSGPLQPANLGAGIAGAKIHLTNEIYELQEILMDNINYTNLMLNKSNLPVVFNSETPIFFIGTSLPKIAHKIIQRMHSDGFFVNLGIFPAVPMKNTGVRFTITNLHKFDQIESMVDSLEKHYFDVIDEENFDINQIYSAFKIKNKNEKASLKVISALESTFNLTTTHHKTITEIDKNEWNTHFTNQGTFDWEGLKFLESSFSNNERIENNWDFDYIIVKDKDNRTVLATFFTTAISKDDMLAPESVSIEIELERKENPYYLSSKTLFMGSLFSEGEHLYLDSKSPDWKGAMNVLFEKINNIKKDRNASNIVLRDFTKISKELNSIFIDNGYYQTKMPNSFVRDNLTWNNDEEFLSGSTQKGRRNVRKEVLQLKNNFNIKVYQNKVSNQKLNSWYELYLNVKHKNLKLNTFTLPFKVFSRMLTCKNWEVIELSDKKHETVLSVVFCYKNNNTYNPMIIGLNYNESTTLKPYKQSLYQILIRARELNLEKVNLGFSADIEKRKVGAQKTETFSYISTDDTYNQTIMANINTNKAEMFNNKNDPQKNFIKLT
jgi:7-keto-8-aminopelargonate synthetase-like enzyme/predicted N-acyltransferase